MSRVGGSRRAKNRRLRLNVSANHITLGALQYMDERDAEDSILTSVSFTSTIHVPLETLFDFSNNYWQERMKLSPSNTLDEELAIWDLLDIDADGDDEPSLDQGSDSMADELLTMP